MPCGTAAPIRSCSRWGLPCRPCCQGRGALLPHRFALARGTPCGSCAGGLFSVALSLGSPPPAISRHRISVEPGLSSDALRCQRPSGRLAAHKCAEPRRRSRWKTANISRCCRGPFRPPFHRHGWFTVESPSWPCLTRPSPPALAPREMAGSSPAMTRGKPGMTRVRPGHDVRHRTCGEGSAGSPNEPPHAQQPRERSGIGLAGDRFRPPMALKRAQHCGERRIQRTLRRHAIADFAKRGAHVAQ